MYVISSRPGRVGRTGKWVVLQSSIAQPPSSSLVQPNCLPSGFISSLSDPLLILIHGYANPEVSAFGQYAKMIGVAGQQGSLFSHGFTGSVIGYDWPSFETLTSSKLQGYKNDYDAACNIGAPVLIDFLNRLAAALMGRNLRINLMAHSMGNLVMCRTLAANALIPEQLDNVISFAADVPDTELEKPTLKAATDALGGNWFVYWAQADIVLMTASDIANMLLGNQQRGEERLGQNGPHDQALISSKVVVQEWDAELAQDLGSHYNEDLREWPFSGDIHSLYWGDDGFLKNVVQNVQRTLGSQPIIATV